MKLQTVYQTFKKGVVTNARLSLNISRDSDDIINLNNTKNCLELLILF